MASLAQFGIREVGRTIKEGVSILPESRSSSDIDVKALPVRDKVTGEDSEF